MRIDQAALLGLASAAAVAAMACTEVRGPSFSNLSNEAVRVSATFDVPPEQTVRDLQIDPGTTFRDPFDQQLVSLTVQAHGRKFELDADAVLKARGSLDKRDQFWVFDGSAICVTTVKGIDAIKREGCGTANGR